MKKWTGFIYVILAGIGFGFLGIFGRLAFNSGLTVGQLLTFRFSLAALILFFGLLIFKSSLLKISLKQFLISCGLGAFGYAVFSTLYFKSIQGLSVSLAALLLFTFPLFVNLTNHFFLNQKMNLKQFMSLLLACLGICLLLWGPVFFDSVIYILYAIGAAVAYSVYVLISGRYQQGVHALTSSVYVILSAAVALAVFHQTNLLSFTALNQNQVLYVVGLSLICTIFPIAFFLMGLQRLSSSKASIIVMIEPVVAALAAWVILGEKLRPLQYFGMALVMCALMLNSRLNYQLNSKSKN